MNTLSWLFYLSQVLPSFGALFGILSTILFFLAMALFVVLLIHVFSEPYQTHRYGDGVDKENIPWLKKYAIITTISAVILFSIGALIPKQNTLLMIASSEFSEEILQNPDVQEITGEIGDTLRNSISLLNQMIDEKLVETEE